jgi:Lrp/AsnC family transcriptional regulator, leucine-responsive regulatory protein
METKAIALDLADRKILAELDKNCRISATQLAKRVRKSREAVKYRIAQLEKKGIITGYIASVNPNKFGFYMFKVYLQLENIPEERERFYQFLRTKKNIYWFGICDGAFDCIFDILSKGVTEYYEEINEICAQFHKLIVRKLLGVMVDTTQYDKKYFAEGPHEKEVTWAGNVEYNEMQSLDFKILNVLANDARIPIAQLARKCSSTIEVVRRRIKRMEDLGIILSYRIDVNFHKLGFEFFKAIIYFKSLSKKDELALHEWMRQNKNSAYYIRSIAPWEAEFEFFVENYLQFNEIIKDLRTRFQHVIRNCEHVIFLEERWMPAYGEIAKSEAKA